MKLGSVKNRTIQIHVTRNCNLRCLHCYSLSGPEVREQLPIDKVLQFMRDAKAEGYEVVSFSGGEPLAYEALPEAVTEAKQMELGVTMVTNGTLFHTPRWDRTKASLDLIAVSLDGPEELHNRVRNSDQAFARTIANLPILRDSGIPFGFIHTVTKESLPHLEWLAEYAVEQGACLLQLHPLGLVGGATQHDNLQPDGEILARTYLMAAALGVKHEGQLSLQVDLFNRESVSKAPEQVYAHPFCNSSDLPLANLLNPLVLMSNGDLSPVCHAMHPRYRLGNILNARLPEIAPGYIKTGYRDFRLLCQELFERLLPTLDWPYFNWYETLELGSYQVGATHRPRF